MLWITAVAMSVMMVGCAEYAGQPSGPETNMNSGENSGENTDPGTNTNSGENSERPNDENDVTDIEVDETVYDYTLVSQEEGNYVYEDENGNTANFSVIYASGTKDCYSVTDHTLTFSDVTEDTVYTITGDFYGNIVIDVTEDYKFELELKNFSLTSYNDCPIVIESADKATLSAKKDTVNYIYDLRSETDENGIAASVYALCDLDVQGKGELFIKSVNNNGIHTKDDLNVKNLNLQVECKDNALKGNDSVTIESGQIVLIAKTGDGIKTTNSDISSKGNQRGTVTISGGEILIYAACDGIDAAYNVVINEATATPMIEIYTDKYSKYSEEVTATAENTYYIRFTSNAYKYSIMYFNDEDDAVWYNSSDYTTVNAGMGRYYYYYTVTKPVGYAYMQLYVYSSSQEQAQSENYVTRTDTLTVNGNYDTIALENRGGSLSYNWTNYSTASTGMGGMGGMGGNLGGMDGGNTDKGDYSTKGMKAGNAVTVSSGTIQISAYDDGIHANCDNTLENGKTPLGNVTVTGGTLTIYSNDDGIHGDGTVTISGGTIYVEDSYEGIEGNTVEISDGNVSVKSSDDGINGTRTSGESIVISGGTLYVYAGGDGLDSNSVTSYDGLLISGGFTVVLSTGSADSCIDTERGYRYTGGYVVGIGRSGGMSSEATTCSPSLSTVGKTATLNLTQGKYLIVENYAVVQLPVSIGALVVFLGSTSASIKSSNSTDVSLDGNGVYWAI